VSNVYQFPGNKDLDVKAFLLNLLEQSDQYHNMMVVAFKDNGSHDVWTTSTEHAFLLVSGAVLTDLGLKSIHDAIVSE